MFFQAPDQIPHMVNEEESDRSFRRVLSRPGRSSDCGQNGWVTVPDKNAVTAHAKREVFFTMCRSILHLYV